MIVSLRHLLGWIISSFRSREDLVLECEPVARAKPAVADGEPSFRLTALHKLFWVWTEKLEPAVRPDGGQHSSSPWPSPAPKRKQTVSWKDFIRSHRDVLVGMDFFTAEVLTLKARVAGPHYWGPAL